ncbi:DUF2092 domain-containing protein [Humitalea sp. 24SJ18S-53]|uniref:DUF2092 domain-containing protein n=1 Tax=Humitalea sp. 24SJ18S-53 TaxID=3422307 RepID=UPI003D666B57
MPAPSPHAHQTPSPRRAKLGGPAWVLAAMLLGACATQPAPPPPVAVAPAPPLDPAIVNAIRAMGATLSAAPALTVRMTSLREAPLPEGQMVLLGATTVAAVQRPNRLNAISGSDLGSIAVWFDGTTLSVLAPVANTYSSTPLAGSIEQMLTALDDRYGIDLPLRPLLANDPAEILLPVGTSGRLLGRTIVGGVACDHYALRNTAADWEIWIATGPRPVPCRVSVVARGVPDAPRLILEFEAWNLQPRLGARDFAFTPPRGAVRVPLLERGQRPPMESAQ